MTFRSDDNDDVFPADEMRRASPGSMGGSGRSSLAMTDVEQMFAFIGGGMLFLWGIRRGGLFPTLALAAAGTLATAGLNRRWPQAMSDMLGGGSRRERLTSGAARQGL